MNKIKDKLLITSFVIYFLIMCKILFLKFYNLFEMLINPFRYGISFNIHFNFIPFKSIYHYCFSGDFTNIYIVLLNVLGNIIIFIPFGIYLLIYKSNLLNIKNSLKTVVLTSLCIEIIQWVFNVGVPDIDDIILNTIGGLIGICIYKMLYYIFKDTEKVKTAVLVLILISAVIYFSLMKIANLNGLRIRLF